MRTWSLLVLRQFLHLAVSALHVFAAAASAAFRSRATLHLENLALRHQLGVLRRSVKRPKLTSADRLLWAWLYEVWNDWRARLYSDRTDRVVRPVHTTVAPASPSAAAMPRPAPRVAPATTATHPRNATEFGVHPILRL